MQGRSLRQDPRGRASFSTSVMEATLRGCIARKPLVQLLAGTCRRQPASWDDLSAWKVLGGSFEDFDLSSVHTFFSGPGSRISELYFS